MLFLDIETKNDWTAGDSFKIENLEISYVGVIDGDTGEEMDFWEEDMEKLGEVMKKTDYVVHYNGFTFDMPVIANYIGDWVNDLPQIDLMVAAFKTIGFRPKLDDLANATLGYGKIGKGSDAVKYWAAGDLESLRKYCLMDCKVTQDVYEWGRDKGFIKYYDKQGFVVTTDIDWELGKRVKEVVVDDRIGMF